MSCIIVVRKFKSYIGIENISVNMFNILIIDNALL